MDHLADLRRDSFITHRAFCDALAVESVKKANLETQQEPKSHRPESQKPESQKPKSQKVDPASPPLPQPPLPVAVLPPSPSAAAVPAALTVQAPTPVPDPPENVTQITEDAQVTTCVNGSSSSSSTSSGGNNGAAAGSITAFASSSGNNGTGASSSTAFASLFTSTSTASATLPDPNGSFEHQTTSFPSAGPTEPISLCLSTTSRASMLGDHQQFSPPQPALSATALLQKAAQMGAVATNASLLRGFGIVSSSSSSSTSYTSRPQDNLWRDHQQMVHEGGTIPSGLGLGLPPGDGPGLKDLMMGSTLFGPKPTTLDLLGLRLGIGTGNTGSALLTSIGSSGLDMAQFGTSGLGSKDMGRSS